MASAADVKRLADVKRRAAEISADWQLARTGTEIHAVVYKGTAPVCIAELTHDCGIADRDFILHTPDDTRFLLRLLSEAFSEIRRYKPADLQKQDQAAASGNYAAECAMRCNDQAFRQFLLEKKAAPDISDSIRVERHVRYLLKVDSRSELNNSAEARKRWFDLRAEFEAWMRDAA